MKLFKEKVIYLFNNPKNKNFKNEVKNSTDNHVEFILSNEHIDKTSFYEIEDFNQKNENLNTIWY